MNKFLTAASRTLRQAFTLDPAATRLLEKTYVQVALSSRFGGN